MARYSTIVPVRSSVDQVGIYTDSGRFFVPGAHRATLEESEELVRRDAEELKQRLGIDNIAGIIPDNVANVTELIFQHAENTGTWLLGGNWSLGHKYDEEFSGLFAVRTKNPVAGENRSPGFATVQLEASSSLPPRLFIGGFVDSLLHNSNLTVSTMRIFVPKAI